MALNTYLRCDSDLKQTHAALKLHEDQTGDKAPTLKRLGIWERDYKWGLWYNEMTHRLQADAAKHAIADRSKNLHFLNSVKNRLMEEIEGVRDETGAYIRAPLVARSLEGASNALLRLIIGEMQILGVDAGDGKQGMKPILEMLGQAMSGDRGPTESKPESKDT